METYPLLSQTPLENIARTAEASAAKLTLFPDASAENPEPPSKAPAAKLTLLSRDTPGKTALPSWPADDLTLLSDAELLLQVSSLVVSQRQQLARLLEFLGEVEERRLHLARAYSSMFDFCTSALHMSEGEAFRRIAAARLARRFPAVLSVVASGALHLSALVLLRDHLTPENHAELFELASHKSKRAVELLLAQRFPRPDVKTSIRRLPAPTAQAERPSGRDGAVGDKAKVSSPEASSAEVPGLGVSNADVPRPNVPAHANASAITPLAPARYRVQLTASQELKDKLERARQLLGSARSTCDIAPVLERALDLLLADLEKSRRGKAARPRRAKPPSDSGAISRAARRAVFERDGERCTFVAPDGRRCTSEVCLEVDHIEPRALGGSGDPDNLRVLCRAHNRLRAEQTFGTAHIEHCLRQRRRRKHPARESCRR